MSESDIACRGKDCCSSSVIIACSCGNPVTFLCQGCISNHVLKPGNHLFLSLKQAEDILSNLGPSHSFSESYSSYLNIKSDILAYINTLKDFRSKVLAFKVEIIDLISETIESKVDQLDILLESAYIKLNEFSFRFCDLPNLDQDLVKRYEEKGLAGLIQDYVYNLILNDVELRDNIRSMVAIGTRDQEGHSYKKKDKFTEIQLFDLKDQLESQIQNLQQDKSEILHVASLQIHELQSNFNTQISDLKLEIQNLKRIRTQSQPEESKLELIPPRTSTCSLATGTRDLIKYDSNTSRSYNYSLRNLLPYDLDYASTCTLSDSEVIIAGGRYYLYRSHSNIQ